MKTTWIFGFAVVAVLVGACLSGVEGNRTGQECIPGDDTGCNMFLGMRCNSAGRCEFTPCDVDGDCAGIAGARCDNEECRTPCAGPYSCAGGAVCDPDSGFCIPDTTTQTVGIPTNLRPLGPGVAGGAGAPPPVNLPINPEDRYEGDY